MDDDANIKSSIAYAIGLTSLKPRNRDATQNDRDRAFAAQKILDHLKLCGWRFWKKPMDPPHSAGGQLPRKDIS